MDSQTVRQLEAQCIQEQPAFCTAACPIHVDARGMIDRIRRGDFKGAFALYARSAPFPRILARICDHPCEASCRRAGLGGAVDMRALEQACATFGGAAPARPRAVPKNQRVAVVGGGLSGLTAAVELAAKGYPVTVLEQQAQLLPRLRQEAHGLLDIDLIEAELGTLASLSVVVRLNTRIDSVAALQGEHSAVYAATGDSSLAVAVDPVTLATADPAVFAGGGHSPIASVKDGRAAAISIDRFLQGASLTASRDVLGPQPTRLYMSTSGYADVARVVPADPRQGYTRDEAIAEASRCFPCGCLECVKACPYLEHYKAYPKRYVREIYNNECIVMGARPANRMINSCTLCGLCAEVCPENLRMADVCLDARQSMVRRGKMPQSAHDFALRDLAFSTSDAFSMVRHQPGFPTSGAVFFPGCQLSASSPAQVEWLYRHLCQTLDGGVGLILGCCGAPAHWAGRPDRFDEVRRSLAEAWNQLGRPRLITACPSCQLTLAEHSPEILVESVWTVLANQSWPDASGPRRRLALHDPCSTRENEQVRADVRRLAERLGIEIEELNPPRQNTCCGYGGLVRFANPEVADMIVARRIAHSPADYLTYCSMCRDSFARQGKRALHVLDLLCAENGPDPAGRPDPGFSRRQENRARLKTRLLRNLWNEPMHDPQPTIDVEIAEAVRQVLERRMILLDDVRQVIAHAEASGEKLRDAASGHFIASCRPSHVTFWVEYSAVDGAFVVHNAYSHRMKVGV